MTLNEVNDDLALPVRPFRVVAVVPVHERLELLPYTIQRLIRRNGVEVICVGDGLKEKAICIEAGARWVEHANKPLGAKWNAGFMAARALGPDAVLYVGSSDWLSSNWITTMKPYLDQHQMVGVPGMHLIDIGTQLRCCYWPGYNGSRKDETIGIGRMLSRKLLDKIDWQPFDSTKDSSLDRSMKDKAKAVGVSDYHVNDDRIKCVSISTNRWVNLHKFEMHWSNLMPSTKIFDMTEILQEFPEANEVFK